MVSASRARAAHVVMLTFLLAGCSCGGDDAGDTGVDANVEDTVAADTDATGTRDGNTDDTGADTSPSDTGRDTDLEDVPGDANEDTSADVASDASDVGPAVTCPDYLPPPPVFPPCSDARACDEICFPPGAANCGVCTGDTCVSDSECAEGDFCVDILALCACSGTGVVTGCLPDCGDAPCPSDEYECVTRPGGSACVLARCTTGSYECGFNQVCDADDGSADVHGCVRRLCATDADCECGSCIGSRCYSGPGTCQPPAP